MLDLENIIVIGTSHENLSLLERENFMRTRPKYIIEKLHTDKKINAYINLSTCLRTEFYIELNSNIDTDELKNLIKYNSLKFLSIFSHLFSASYTDGLEVIKKFTDLVNKLGKNNFEMIHLQNAAGIYNYDVEIVTHIRTGMLTYGLQEAGFYDLDLKPVFTGLIGYVDSVRYVNELDYVAYQELSSIDPGTKKIAKIKIGYGDGFSKANNKTTCLIKKKEYVISQVTMDNTFIEVDDRVNVGDEVHLYHRPNEIKTKTGFSMLELLIAISPLRVKRIFKGEEN